MSGFRHVGDDRVLYEGRVWDAVAARFEAPDGSTFTREIVRARGAVAVVAISYADDDPAHRRPLVTLLRQYRGAVDQLLYELPAGMRDVAGEPPAETARRELVEEVGLSADGLDELHTIATSPGILDERLIIYLADDCRPVERQPLGPEERFAEVLTVPLADAVAMIDERRIDNATAIIGLLLAERRLSSP